MQYNVKNFNCVGEVKRRFKSNSNRRFVNACPPNAVMLRIAVTVLALLSLIGCRSDAARHIGLVQDAVLPGYDTTRLGKALEGTFQRPEWHYVVDSKGRKTVTFTGRLAYDKMRSDGFYTYKHVQVERETCTEAVLSKHGVRHIEPPTQSTSEHDISDSKIDFRLLPNDIDKDGEAYDAARIRYEAEIRKCVDSKDIPITFTFVFRVNSSEFSLSDSELRLGDAENDEASRKAVIAYVYR